LWISARSAPHPTPSSSCWRRQRGGAHRGAQRRGDGLYPTNFARDLGQIADLALIGTYAWFVCINLGAAYQGTLGFGFPVVATPLVALVLDMKSAIVRDIRSVSPCVDSRPIDSL